MVAKFIFFTCHSYKSTLVWESLVETAVDQADIDQVNPMGFAVWRSGIDGWNT